MGTPATGDWKQSHLIHSLPQRFVDEGRAVDTICLDFSKAINSLSDHTALRTWGCLCQTSTTLVFQLCANGSKSNWTG